MKYLKRYEAVVRGESNIRYLAGHKTWFEIYFTHTKDGVTESDRFYITVFSLENAYIKVKKLINSFLEIDDRDNYINIPRFKNWTLDDYYIKIIENGKVVDILDKQLIDASFDVDKYNL